MIDGLRIAWRPVPPGTARRDTAWALVRELVGDVDIVAPCPFCGGPHGPVQLPGTPWRASVSYAGEVAVVGVMPAADATAFGIDAEPAGTPGARAWTRVEAALKADGRGLRVAPESVRITPDGSEWTAVVPGRDGEGERRYRGVDVTAPDDLVVSAAFRAAS
ncbi:chemotaxis protein CheY [Microbacterium candidum]|uniref:Chemotaxis protein CheY n=1 Tax=Microbacterium candidum TaxID=3041922 RepID=A0ABT7N302_9MICO|nr:chemotaxis protein CheY [Microbacterium sp. ASV49]MDL9981058.1 chemotaxis protein CheY [Microbacterium sp. ASV49]